jgi:hypothetical protein
MRKKTEIAIKVLNEKIKKLENELQKQYVINEFLLNHDRKDVVVDCYRFDYIALTYVYGNELKFPCIPNFFYEQEVEVETNTSETIVLKIKDMGLRREVMFIKVKKSSGEWLDITDVIIAERKKEEPPTVANPDTPTEPDFKYFTADQVRNMSHKEVRENYSNIMKSMKKW